MKTVIAILLLVAWPSVVEARDQYDLTDGLDLKLALSIDPTTTKDELVMKATAIGYIMGIFEAHTAWSHVRWCLPDGGGISRAEGVAVVLKYIADHPAALHEPAAGVVMNALVDSYRCSK